MEGGRKEAEGGKEGEKRNYQTIPVKILGYKQ